MALAALAFSVLLLTIWIQFGSRPETSTAVAQGSAPCGTDPSCSTMDTPPFPGDVNCDGVINELDVPVMISLVFDCNLCPACNTRGAAYSPGLLVR